jgi:SAM-dependent methyltransferase
MNAFHRWYCRSSHWNRALADLVPWALDGLRLGDHVLELGAGPGGATRWLAGRTARVTTIDLEPSFPMVRGPMAIHTVRGDATILPFRSSTFSAAVACTMLHHVPSVTLQQQLFAEVARTLRPGGIFAALDVQGSTALRLIHVGDTWMPIAAATLPARLASAGLDHAVVATRGRYFRCAAVRALPHF